MVTGTTFGLGAERATGPLTSSPEAGKSVEELIASTGGGANAAFDFQHKVFALPGVRFAIDRRARAPMFYMHLGNLDVSLTPAVLRREFQIETASHDSHLIELAAKALRFVGEVRPGDSVPTELIDGSASWTVEDGHRRLAKAKLLAQLSAWVARDKKGLPLEDILALGEDELAASDAIQSALAAATKTLGLELERMHEVAEQLDAVARELAYIEGLREHAARLHDIRERVLQLTCAAKGENRLIEELTRILALLKQPLAEFADRFARLDTQTSDLAALLLSPWIQISRIRAARDEIHTNLLAWSAVIERWHDQEVILNPDTHQNVHDLHRWLAANYAPTVVWQ
jgi:hypothetical protein